MINKLLIAAIFCFSITGSHGQSTAPKLEIKQLTTNFYIYTTYNEYKGGKIPANGMYLVTPDGVALFDTPWDTTQFQPLLDSIEKRHHRPVVINIATHFHDDRTAGLEFYRRKGVRTYTTKKTDELSVHTGRKRAQFITTKDTVFRLGGYAFEVFYPGEGHTSDNIVIWFPREKIIYGACLIKSADDEDLGYLGDANKLAYAATLRNVQQHCPKPRFIIVGHGDWTNIKSLDHSIQMADALREKYARARDIGIPFNGTPGKYNAITDVAGVEVGYSTIISGQGVNTRGKGPVRTGVTAILPRGRNNNPVFANWYSLNGNGEMTGTTWITESGFLETPIMITNTNSVGVVRDAVLKWFVRTGWYKEDFWYTYPVVAETYDGFLNDIYGFHVEEKHAWEALDGATPGPLQEGNVGGGTGMMCLGFKGGTGTSSRVVKIGDSTYTIGVLVQANFGSKRNLTIAGVPVGMELKDTLNNELKAPPSYQPGDGSIIVVVATDAPLLPHQLKRIAARVPLGIGIVGGRGENGSGDIFIAFSTANTTAFQRDQFTQLQELPNDQINPLFNGTVQAVEEAIINAMVAAETMEGINGNKSYALPHQKVIEILRKYNRIH